MNRPYWLDLFYVAAFFVPPTAAATVATILLSKWLKFSSWLALGTYITSVILATTLWLVGLVAWARLKSSKNERQDCNGNEY
jgi:hypothetical protein